MKNPKIFWMTFFSFLTVLFLITAIYYVGKDTDRVIIYSLFSIINYITAKNYD